MWAACALLERMSAQSFAYRSRLQLEASTDALTGLNNRREFESGMVREMERARRMQVPLSLAIIDIDFFKRINDQHGHDSGDVVLRQVAQTLQAHIRKSDLLARIGGEEFALVMLGTQPPGAWVVLERLRVAVAGLRMAAGAQDDRLHDQHRHHRPRGHRHRLADALQARRPGALRRQGRRPQPRGRGARARARGPARARVTRRCARRVRRRSAHWRQAVHACCCSSVE